MRIRVQDIATKRNWLAKVSLFLHDASICERFAYDDSTQTFSLALHRIGYEFRKRQRKLWFVVWAMPSVPCTLSLAPVAIVQVNEGPDPWVDWGEQLVYMDMVGPADLEVVTREARVVLRLQERASLVLADTGAPTHEANHKDFGSLVVPEQLVTEVSSTAEV